MTRVLVCGGRTFGLIPKDTASVDLSAAKTRAFHDAQFLWETLDGIHSETPITFLMEPGSSGAAFLAYRWRVKRGVEGARFIAKWRPEGKDGPIDKNAGRANNDRMLTEGQPDLVVAFQGGRATEKIVARATEAGVKIIHPRQTDLEACAKLFATAAYGATGMTLDNGEPYITLIRKTVELVRSVPHTPEMVAGAWLSDVIDKTDLRIDGVQSAFGKVVAELVRELSVTTVSSEDSVNFTLDDALKYISSGSACSKTIRLAHVVATTQSISPTPTSTFRTLGYLQVMEHILPCLQGGDPKLFDMATKVLAEARAKAAA